MNHAFLVAVRGIWVGRVIHKDSQRNRHGRKDTRAAWARSGAMDRSNGCKDRRHWL